MAELLSLTLGFSPWGVDPVLAAGSVEEPASGMEALTTTFVLFAAWDVVAFFSAAFEPALLSASFLLPVTFVVPVSCGALSRGTETVCGVALVLLIEDFLGDSCSLSLLLLPLSLSLPLLESLPLLLPLLLQLLLPPLLVVDDAFVSAPLLEEGASGERAGKLHDGLFCVKGLMRRL